MIAAIRSRPARGPGATTARGRRSDRACTGRTRASRSPGSGSSFESSAADPGPEAPLDDVVVGLEPQVVRRHRPLGVLAQERGQRVHVVALEGVDVAVQEGLLRLVERRRRGRRRPGRGCRASPAPAGARCSPMRRSCRAAPRPRRRASGAPRAGSARPAAAAAGAGARRRTRGGPTRGRSRPRPGRRPSGTTRASGTGSIQTFSGSASGSGVSALRAGSRSIGRARRWLAPSMSRQTFVAIR